MRLASTIGIIAFIISALCLPVLAQQMAVVGGDRYYVLGEVNTPGDFEFKDGVTVKSAIQTAGGLSPRADKKGGVLLRENDKTALDVGAILDGSAADVTLVAGDTLLVKPGTFRVEGKVSKPGQYDIMVDLQALKALAMAGGAVEGADLSSAYIKRGEKIVRIDLNADAKPVDVAVILAGDVLTVPELTVSVTGEVARPGMYTLLPGKTDKLQDAISAAGGTTKKADLKKVSLTTASGDKEQTTAVDATKATSPEANPVLRSGDNVYVPEKGSHKRKISATDVYQAIVIIFTLGSIF